MEVFMKKLTFNTFYLFLILAVVTAMMFSPLFAKEIKKEKDNETLFSWVQTLPEATQLEIERIMGTSPAMIRSDYGDAKQDQEAYIDWVYNELKLVLEPGQYEKFVSLVTKPGKKIAKPMTICSSPCYSLYLYRLSYAHSHMDSAITERSIQIYQGTYGCSLGGTDYLGTHMGFARFYLSKAMDDIQDAYENCDCSAAQSGEYYINQALTRFSQADGYISTQCPSGYSSSWLTSYNGSKNYTNLASSTYQSCEDDVCD